MKSKAMSLLLAGAMALSLTACASSASSNSNSSSSATSDKQVQTVILKTGKEVSGTVTYSIDMSSYDKGKAVKVWLPIPTTSDYQEIGYTAYDASGGKAELTEDSNGNKMLYIEWDKDTEPSSRTATCSFHVDRYEYLRPNLVENGTVGDDMKEYLESTSTVPVDGEVKAKAEEITKGKTTVLEKARAIYDWIIENMNRDESVKGCGTGDVCTLLSSKAGKCTDINSVFVGLCRAAGIPARETFGVRINAEDITKNQHCWAQFYLPGTGWVFADPADVLKAVLKNNWSKDSDETKEKAEYYWGSVDAERVSLSTGRDVELNPKQSGDKLNNFGYPYAEVDGTAVDYYDPTTFVYKISFAADSK